MEMPALTQHTGSLRASLRLNTIPLVAACLSEGKNPGLGGASPEVYICTVAQCRCGRGVDAQRLQLMQHSSALKVDKFSILCRVDWIY